MIAKQKELTRHFIKSHEYIMLRRSLILTTCVVCVNALMTLWAAPLIILIISAFNMLAFCKLSMSAIHNIDSTSPKELSHEHILQSYVYVINRMVTYILKVSLLSAVLFIIAVCTIGSHELINSGAYLLSIISMWGAASMVSITIGFNKVSMHDSWLNRKYGLSGDVISSLSLLIR